MTKIGPEFNRYPSLGLARCQGAPKGQPVPWTSTLLKVPNWLFWGSAGNPDKHWLKVVSAVGIEPTTY